MAWKCKLLSVGQSAVTVQYYETISGDTKNENYGINQFNTKAELQTYCSGVVTGLNAALIKYNQLTTALTSSLDTDIA